MELAARRVEGSVGNVYERARFVSRKVPLSQSPIEGYLCFSFHRSLSILAAHQDRCSIGWR